MATGDPARQHARASTSSKGGDPAARSAGDGGGVVPLSGGAGGHPLPLRDDGVLRVARAGHWEAQGQSASLTATILSQTAAPDTLELAALLAEAGRSWRPP